MKLAILIPTLISRKSSFLELERSLWRQIEKLPNPSECKIISLSDSGGMTIGAKRNILIQKAIEKNAEYICFFDDDDTASDIYVKEQMNVCESGLDCGSLKGLITIDWGTPELFEHSTKYNEWRTNENSKEGEVKYERFPNHLNCIKTEIIKQFRFPEKNFGEDHVWSKLIHMSGLIKTEHYIPEVLYCYNYISNK